MYVYQPILLRPPSPSFQYRGDVANSEDRGEMHVTGFGTFFYTRRVFWFFFFFWSSVYLPEEAEYIFPTRGTYREL